MQTVVYKLFSKSAKHNINPMFDDWSGTTAGAMGWTRESVPETFLSRGIRRTDLNPVNGLKICATSLSVASAGIPSTYMVLVEFSGT